MSEAPERIWISRSVPEFTTCDPKDPDFPLADYETEYVRADLFVRQVNAIEELKRQYISPDEHSRICDKLATALEDKYEKRIEKLERERDAARGQRDTAYAEAEDAQAYIQLLERERDEAQATQITPELRERIREQAARRNPERMVVQQLLRDILSATEEEEQE